MSDIPWCDETWQVVSGCTPVSEGCRFCYSARLAGTRLKNHPLTAGLTRKAGDGRYVFNGVVRCNEDQLGKVGTWRKPRRIFVGDRGDLFHDDVPSVFIHKVLNVAAANLQHDYLFLTKRPARMTAEVLAWMDGSGSRATGYASSMWFGTSIEDQATANARLPELWPLMSRRLCTWVSVEPLLDEIDLTRCAVPRTIGGKVSLYYWDALRGGLLCGDDGLPLPGNTDCRLEWVVVGGESGRRARMCWPEWIDGLLEQCRPLGDDGYPGESLCPIYVKQTGTALAGVWTLKDRKGENPAEWPGPWYVRDFPASMVQPREAA